MYRKQPGTETEWIRKDPGSAQTFDVDEELTGRTLHGSGLDVEAHSRIRRAGAHSWCRLVLKFGGMAGLSSQSKTSSLYRGLRLLLCGSAAPSNLFAVMRRHIPTKFRIS